MVRNTNVVVLHTRKYEKLTLDNFEKQKESGVIYLRCPETHQEIPFRWSGKTELNKIRKLHKEIKDEYKLRMVS